MNAPTIYNYHPVTGEFLSTGLADPDPRIPNNWLIPANATTIAPPAPADGHTAAFINGAWVSLKDHRGETWWKDGQSYTITGLGDPSAEGFSPDGPPETGEHETAVWEDGEWAVYIDRRGETWWADHNTPVLVDFLGDPADHDLHPERPPYVEPDPEPDPEPELTFEEKVAAKFAALSDRRFAAETGGIIFNGVPIQTDRSTAAILTAAYVLANENPEYVIPNWKAATGVFISLDAPTILAVSGAVRDHIQACFNHEAALSAQILAAEDEAALDAIDINAGWPG